MRTPDGSEVLRWAVVSAEADRVEMEITNETTGSVVRWRSRCDAGGIADPTLGLLATSGLETHGEVNWPAELETGVEFGGTIEIAGIPTSRGYVVEGRERARVGGREFDVWRLEILDGGRSSGTMWVSEGVGIVRIAYPHSSGEHAVELVEIDDRDGV